MDEADILFERRGRLGLITLNRPKALNALTHDMALALERQLDDWRGDRGVEVVAIQGGGEKAFCAGGDIRVLYDAGRADGRNNFQFYADEYRLNTKIQRYPKPYVALMDGIVMGGGVGVSVHGSLRIATERTLFAMPETGIGLFPDVGGTWFLPRLPGRVGIWLGLTGSRLKGKDAVRAGVCDFFLESAHIPELIEFFAYERPGDRSLPPYDPRVSMFSPSCDLTLWQSFEPLDLAAEIDSHFSGDSVESILNNLLESETEWAMGQRSAILAKSPTCTRIAFRQIRAGASLAFEDCMALEYRLARFCMTQPDFYEGVRAVILDKDNAPRWTPATLAEADDAHVAPAFAPLGDEELVLGSG